MNAQKWVFITIIAALIIVGGIGIAIALQGLAGNPSSSLVEADMRTATETANPSVSSLTMGKTFRIYKEIDFSDYPTSNTYLVEIGTIPAYSLIRDAVFEVVTAEASSECSLWYATTEAVADVDVATTGTVATATLYASRAATVISVGPNNGDHLESAVIRVWVCGEVLTERGQ